MFVSSAEVAPLAAGRGTFPPPKILPKSRKARRQRSAISAGRPKNPGGSTSSSTTLFCRNCERQTSNRLKPVAGRDYKVCGSCYYPCTLTIPFLFSTRGSLDGGLTTYREQTGKQSPTREGRWKLGCWRSMPSASACSRDRRSRRLRRQERLVPRSKTPRPPQITVQRTAGTAKPRCTRRRRSRSTVAGERARAVTIRVGCRSFSFVLPPLT